MQRLPVQHPRLTDGELGDVDHLLNFAIAFRLDLAVLERDDGPERAAIRRVRRRERRPGRRRRKRIGYPPAPIDLQAQPRENGTDARVEVAGSCLLYTSPS